MRARQAPHRGIQLALPLRQHGLVGLFVAFALGHQCLRAGQGGHGLLLARDGLGQHGLQRVDLHVGQELAGGDEVALLYRDVLYAPGELGGHVHLGGLDAAIAAGEVVAWAGGAHLRPGIGACSHCRGRGTIIRNPCKTCRGTGKTAARKSLEINIPAGIDDDQNIALRGQGDAGSNGGPAGDVIVHVTVKADPMFERDGYDVTIHVPITFSQAVLGDDVEVPTVDGRIVQHIPEGTQSGTKFRLRGQGIQYLNGRGRGDQYVIVDVEIPKKVTRAQREALKAFEDSMKEDNYEKRKGFFKNLRDRFS